MPRRKRIILSNRPHLILHRGYDGNVVFVGEDDYRFYLDNLWSTAKQLGCKVYAYSLLLNQVQLIVDPGAEHTHLGRLMKTLAGRQAGYAKRRGMLNGSPFWKRRFSSSLIVTTESLLACCRLVELAPVHACLAARPDDYAWSSCRTKLGLDTAPISFDSSYMSLGPSAADRIDRYQRYLSQKVPEQERMAIQRALQSGNFVTSLPTDVNELLVSLEKEIPEAV